MHGYLTGMWNRGLVKFTSSVLCLLLVMFADHSLGYGFWNYLCTNKSGIFIHKKVVVKGYEDQVSVGGPKVAKDILDHGYKYIEGESIENNRKIIRYQIDSKNRVAIIPVTKPHSRYLLSMLHDISIVGIVTYEYRIVDKKNGDLLAVGRKYGFLGGWLMRSIRNLTGIQGAEYCKNDLQISKLVTSTLIPNDE